MPTTTVALSSSPPAAQLEEGISLRSSTSDDVDGLDDAEVSSESNVDLLEETERLLAKIASKGNHSLVASSQINLDSSANNTPSNKSVATSTDQNQSISMNMVANNTNENNSDDHELDQMLLKAGNLSSMMLMSKSENSITHQKRDPDGNSVSELNHVVTSPVDSSPTDHNSRDPPGSVVDEFDADNHNNNRVTPPLQQPPFRPTSSVHLHPSHEMDDDVSSVGSQSFRPSFHTLMNSGGAAARNNYGSPFVPPPAEQEPPHMSPQRTVPSANQDQLMLDLATNNNHNVDTFLEDPICHKLPAVDLRADFDVVSQTRRDAAFGDDAHSVQWEKVDTAHEGEDDYVPLVDYSHMTPKNNINSDQQGVTFASSSSSPGSSRLDALRRRNQARQKRRTRLMMLLAVSVAMAAAVYHHYYYQASPPLPPAVAQVVVVEKPKQTYVTGSEADGYTIEGDDPSLIVALPRVPSPVVVEEKKKKKRRWFWGIFGNKKKKKKKKA